MDQSDCMPRERSLYRSSSHPPSYPIPVAIGFRCTEEKRDARPESGTSERQRQCDKTVRVHVIQTQNETYYVYLSGCPAGVQRPPTVYLDSLDIKREKLSTKPLRRPLLSRLAYTRAAPPRPPTVQLDALAPLDLRRFDPYLKVA
eukprot:1194888-Prorocentrum_minimum.AAC.1